MAKMVDIEARDVYFLVEFPLEELKLLLKALDMAEIACDEENEEEVKARDYLLEYDKFLEGLYQRVENAPNNQRK